MKNLPELPPAQRQLVRAEVVVGPHRKVVVIFPSDLTNEEVLHALAELAMGMRESTRKASLGPPSKIVRAVGGMPQ